MFYVVLSGVRKSWELRKYRTSQSEILFSTAESGKSHLESRGFAKHIENGESESSIGKAILLVNLFCFFLPFHCFAGYRIIALFGACASK